MGGVSPYSYLWNTSENTSIIIPLSNGTYWCVVTDANNCFSDTSYFYVQNIPSSDGEINFDKRLKKVVDILGRDSRSQHQDILLFYIYNDGTIEKRIITNQD